MWDRKSLHELIDTRLRGNRLIVVANREPYIHRYVGDVVECMLPGQRDGGGARPDHARLRRHLGGSRLG